MKTTSPLSHEVWERTPAEAQAYIRMFPAALVFQCAVPDERGRLPLRSSHPSFLGPGGMPPYKRKSA